MRKRILAFLCSAAMLLCLFPVTASAAGTLEGVDYSRIAGTGWRTTLTLGELEFEGQLSRGSTLSQSEQDKIIRQTMIDLNITSGMLINAKTMLDKAHNLKGFGIEDVTKALFKLAGVETEVDLYRYVMGTGKKTSAEIAADIAKGEAQDAAKNGLEAVLTDGGRVALQGTGKYAFKLLFMLPDLTQIGLDALAKYENIKETIAASVERQFLLNAFYNECNKRITEASGDRGAWEIRFDKKSTQTYNCTFWGVPGVMMEASLSGVLEQVSEIDDYAGQYRGTLWLDIEGVDMGSFDKAFKASHNFTLLKRKMDGYQMVFIKGDYKDTPEQITQLKREMQGEISVMITGGKGTQTSEVSGSLTSGNDETEFSFAHIFSWNSSYLLISDHFSMNLISSSIEKISGHEDAHRILHSPTPYKGDEYYSYSLEDFEVGPDDIGTVWKPLESKPVITVYK